MLTSRKQYAVCLRRKEEAHAITVFSSDQYEPNGGKNSVKITLAIIIRPHILVHVSRRRGRGKTTLTHRSGQVDYMDKWIFWRNWNIIIPEYYKEEYRDYIIAHIIFTHG